MTKKVFQIAIDGPVGSGKSTVTKLVAEKLGFLYVDTGAMYRAATLLGVRAGMDLNDEDALVELVKNNKIELRAPIEKEKDGRLVTLFLNQEDVSWKIRRQGITKLVPKVAAMSKVRKELVKRQQEIAQSQNVVMEGRDITFRVLPNADLKIYLTALPEERAKRRRDQLLSKGEDINFEIVLKDLIERDKVDMGREADPLQIVNDAWVLDTTKMTIKEVVDAIYIKVEELRDK